MPKAEKNDLKRWEKIKYFKPRDFSCRCEGLCDHQMVMSMDLVEKVDRIADLVGFQVTILKGSTCQAFHDRKKGQGPAGFSPHLPDASDGRVYAVDILAPNANAKYAIVAAAMAEGIKGIEIGSGKNYVHLEDSPRMEQTNLWAR